MSTIDVKADVCLRPYQSRALERIECLRAHGVRRLLVVAPTGAGKTIVIAELGRRWAADGVLVVAHRRELISQTYAKLLQAGLPESSVGVLMASDARRRPVAPVQVASIDSLRNRPKPPARVVIVDEAHRELSNSYVELRERYPDAFHLGFTATPFRADNRGLGEFYEELVVVATIGELIALGFLVEPRVFTVPTKDLPRLAGVHVRRGDYDARELETAVDQTRLVGNIVEHWQKRAAGLRTVAFAVSVKHSQHIVERFRAAGVAAEHLDGATPTHERDAILRRLEHGETRVVSNCGVLCLDEKTEILTLAGWIGIDTMTATHRVANWDDGMVTFEPPLDIVRRARLPGERMAALKGRSIDIRVTEGHAIVYRSGARHRWRKRPARELVDAQVDLPACGRADALSLVADASERGWTRKRINHAVSHTKWNVRHLERRPEREAESEARWRVARRMCLRAKDPSELSLAECSFVGFWLGDGSVSWLKSGGIEYKVFESSRNPRIVVWLEEIIGELGVDFIKRTLEPHEKSREVKYRRTAPCFAWSFPRGTGGGSQARRGLFDIEPYLEREGSDLYWGFDDAQFAALLHGFWMSDGNHRQGAETLPASFSIYNARTRLLDRIQAVAAARGYRTNLRPTTTEGVARLSVVDRPTFSIGTHRLALEEADRDERVWCVRTRTGNIITRRNGSVVVLGNCEGWDQPSVKCAILARPTESTGLYLQQAGRILRPFEGVGAIILDHAGCARAHGLPQDDREFSLASKPKRKRTEADEVSIRVCDGCQAVLPGRMRVCPECGYVVTEEREVPDEVEGELVELTRVEMTHAPPAPRPPRKKAIREAHVLEGRRAAFEQMWALARGKQKAAEWAVERYTARYGAPPPDQWLTNAWGAL